MDFPVGSEKSERPGISPLHPLGFSLQDAGQAALVPDTLLWASRVGRQRCLPTQTPLKLWSLGVQGLNCRFLFCKYLTLSDLHGVDCIHRSCVL